MLEQDYNCSRDALPCKAGLILPQWLPPEASISSVSVAGRAFVYIILLLYMFVGVSIISDRFMASIEVITSKTKTINIAQHDGTELHVQVKIWNETVSNLTLMALGSSTPEILLSVIELMGNNFEAGDLGPGTIVGSAAFNLFIIIAVCIACIPNGENRAIYQFTVFIITASWSIFAYVWLYFIVALSSRGEVELWEALVTLAFFPVTVISAYFEDRRKSHAVKYDTKGLNEGYLVGRAVSIAGDDDGNISDEEKKKRHVELMHSLRTTENKDLERLLQMERENRCKPKSHAYNRLAALSKLTGRRRSVSKSLESNKIIRNYDKSKSYLYFDPCIYTVMENVGTVRLTVKREGGNTGKSCRVDFETQDGTAHKGKEYIARKGSISFGRAETEKHIELTILDNDTYNDDSTFYTVLTNARFVDSANDDTIELGDMAKATLVILDDDHPGVFYFKNKQMTTHENIDILHVNVTRGLGARGRVVLPYRTVARTAKEGDDYVNEDSEIIFEDEEYDKNIEIIIINHESYEVDKTFLVVLEVPYEMDGNANQSSSSSSKRSKPTGSQGSLSVSSRVTETNSLESSTRLPKPALGNFNHILINIKESEDFKQAVDKIFLEKEHSLGQSSWSDQFKDAIFVQRDGTDVWIEDEHRELYGDDLTYCPSFYEYFLHFLTVIWKVLFAFVPPTTYCGGWLCFACSIACIGVLTAIIGDLASHFGCTIGLKDSVTAISIVALGTSVPDTFASKLAAMNDEYADSSIGNVTGSNAVNVFLGIGIAWTCGAVYHMSQGGRFLVPTGELGISVTVFCCLAFCAILLLVLRRRMPKVGGELGGPTREKIISSSILVMFWLIYLTISILKAYCYI